MLPLPTRMRSPALRTGFRALVALMLAAGFLVIVRLTEPAASTAQPLNRQSPPTVPQPEVRHDDRLYLGSLEGFNHSVRLFTTARGPRYSILDGVGDLIATDLSADEVHEFLPGFDLGSTRARITGDPLLLDGPLMMADHD